MSEYIVFFFLIIVIVICVSGFIMLMIRNSKSALNSDSKDVFDMIADRLKNHLSKIPDSLSFRVYVSLMFGLPIIVAIGSYIIFDNLFMSFCLAVISGLTPELLIQLTKNKHKKQFEIRYMKALKILADSLKAGLSFHQSVKQVHKSPFLHEIIRREFRQIDSDIEVGISIPNAFKNMSDRISTIDTLDVAAAVKLLSIIGGSEAEVIDSISSGIDERIKMRREVKSIFAGPTMLVYIFDFVPILMIALVMLFGGELYNYFSSFNLIMILLGIVSVMFLGSLWAHRKIQKIKSLRQ